MNLYLVTREDHDYDQPRGWVIRAASMAEAKDLALRDIKRYDRGYSAGVSRLKGRIVKVDGKRSSIILTDFLNG